MLTRTAFRIAAVLVVASSALVAHADNTPVGTMFTYQGRLTQQGEPVTGTVDLAFQLYETAVGGNPLATLTADDFEIGDDGRFTIDLDFGDEFDGSPRWLAITVNSQTLSPRQPIMPAPYAMVATTAANVPTKAVVGHYTGITGVGTLDSLNVSGNVGIGTSSPLRPLHVFTGSAGVTPHSNASGVFERSTTNYLNILSPSANARGILFGDEENVAKGGIVFNPSNVLNGLSLRTGGNNTRMVISDSGNVGIGTTDPQWPLHVMGRTLVEAAGIPIQGIKTDGGSFPAVLGQTNATATQASGVRGEITNPSPGSSAAGVWGRNLATSNSGVGVRGTHGAGGTGVIGESESGTGVRGISNSADGYGGVFGDLFGPGRGILVVAESHLLGSTGVGTTSPNSQLHINAASGNALRAQISSATKLLVHSNGNVMIGSAATPQDTLHVAGTTRTNVIRIMGGSDLSERFDVAELDELTPQPGMVVCIDPANPGKLIPSTRAYNRTVAGVISGANGINSGMIMGQEGTEADGAFPVALTGRVYVMVDASGGAIEPGDLLTTSDVPGHAMKVSDFSRAHGAIIGKAMSPLAAGERGLVLVLVGLQ